MKTLFIVLFLFLWIDIQNVQAQTEERFVLYAIDASDKHIAIGTNSKIIILEAKTGKLVYEFHPGHGYITSVDFSKDGRYVLASGGSYENGYLESWDLKKGKAYTQYEGHTQYAWRARYSDDGKKVYSVGFDKQFFTFSASAGVVLSNVQTEETLYDVGEISNDLYFVGGGYFDSYAASIEASELKRLKPTFHRNRIEALTISPDKRWAITGDLDGKIVIWDLVNQEPVKKLETPAHEDYHSDGISNLMFSPDNRTLLVGSRDGKISFWNWSTGLLMQEWTGFNDRIYGLAISPDNKYVFVGEAFTGKIYCKDFQTGKTVWEQSLK